jgi:hypothetical protein
MRKLLVLSILVIVTSIALSKNSDFLLDGTCNIYNTNGWNLSDLSFESTQFRDSWNTITQFNFNGTSYLIFYDRLNKEATLLNINMNMVREYSTDDKWREIKHIVAIDINSDGNDELLFYRTNLDDNCSCQGEAFLYSLNNNFDLILLNHYTGWRSTWKDIISFDFDNDGKKELLFYDPVISTYSTPCVIDNGRVELYRLNSDYGMSLLWYNTDFWRKTWKIISPISFNEVNNNSGLLLYDSYNNGQNIGGHIELLRYINNSFVTVYSSDYFEKNIKQIIIGKFNSTSDSFSDVLMYSQENGTGQFYKIINNNLQIANSLITGWRKTWSLILPLKINNSNDKILYYESLNNTELCIPTYDETNQALHPDIILGNDGLYKMVFTPYAYAKDWLENPSVLESTDGNIFNNIPYVSNPLVLKPFPLSQYQTYNNDPDILNDGTYYYVVYNETMKEDASQFFYQNIKILKYNQDFILADSNTILQQCCLSTNATFAPSLIKYNSLYYLFAVNNFKVVFLYNKSINSRWSSSSKLRTVTFANASIFYPWHINVINNQYTNEKYMLISGNFNYSTVDKNNLYIAKCNSNNDFSNWTLYPIPILDKKNYVCTQIYRSGGIFQNSNTLTIYYSFFKDNNETGIGIKRNLYVDPAWFQTGNIKKGTISKFESSCYPNPFNPNTTIKYAIPYDEFVTITIYDLSGKEIAKLINEKQRAGSYSVKFDGKNLASGTYFYKIQAGIYLETKKIILLK